MFDTEKLRDVAALISDLLVRCYGYALTVRRGVVSPPSGLHVILSPSYRGNLGDEAMLASCIENIAARGGRVVLLNHNTSDDWSDLGDGIRQISIEGYFSVRGWHKACRQIRNVMAEAQTFNILGADIMDGAYSRTRSFRRILLADIAIRMGVDTAILGFSFSDKARPSTVRYLKQISDKLTLYARDEFSQARINAFSRSKAKLVADTAFLMSPADSPSAAAQEALKFAKQSRHDMRPVIIFNANPLGSSMSSGANRGSASVRGLQEIVVANVEAIVREVASVAIIFMAHDRREPHNDTRLLEDVYKSLPSNIQNKIHLATRDISAREVKLLCGTADLVVTGRMHLGIASLGMSTPCLFLDFQGKVRGLLKHFDAEEMFFDWHIFNDPRRYALLVSKHLQRSASARLHLGGKISGVRNLSRGNFERFSAA